MKDEYSNNGMYKKEIDPEVTCWHCKKTFLCDCMDATCRLCGAPYAKDRCKEFNFVPYEKNNPKYCMCEKPQRCNLGTGLIGWSESSFGVGQCNICHKCKKLIDNKFDVVKPLEAQ